MMSDVTLYTFMNPNIVALYIYIEKQYKYGSHPMSYVDNIYNRKLYSEFIDGFLSYMQLCRVIPPEFETVEEALLEFDKNINRSDDTTIDEIMSYFLSLQISLTSIDLVLILFAIENGNFYFINVFIKIYDRKFDINILISELFGIKYPAAFYTLMYENLIKFFIDVGLDVNQYIYGKPIFMYMMVSCDIIRLLCNSGMVDINLKCIYTGRTIFHDLIMNRNVSYNAVKCLLEYY